MNIHLLIVDHEERFLSTSKFLMEKQGIRAKTALSGAEALKILSETPIDVAVINIEMPGIGAMEIMAKIKRKYPLVEVILMANHASAASAIEGLKKGAFDYIMKPCDAPTALQKIQEARKKKAINEERIHQSKVHRIISHPMAIFDNDNDENE